MMLLKRNNEKLFAEVEKKHLSILSIIFSSSDEKYQPKSTDDYHSNFQWAKWTKKEGRL